MVNEKSSRRPTICFRPIRPSDLDILDQIHSNVFPIRYEPEFFQNVVNGRDIVSWAAVDRSRPDGHSDELVGFVTARIVLAKESEISDLIRYDGSKFEQTLIYVLTLGVVEEYRNFGIASSLIREVIKYASSIATCRGVYLHVISYNNPAIHLYQKISFKCIRRLHGFYLINGQHYDSYLFVYYVNGGRSPCSPLSWRSKCFIGLRVLDIKWVLGWTCNRKRELISAIVTYMKSGIKLVSARLRKSEEKGLRWSKCKENCALISSSQSKRNMTTESTGCECV